MNQHRRRNPEVIINGDVVKRRRKAFGLTQVELGLMADCHSRVIAQIEKGRALDPATSVTLRLAKALSLTVEALCAGARPYTSRTIHDPEPQVAMSDPDQIGIEHPLTPDASGRYPGWRNDP